MMRLYVFTPKENALGVPTFMIPAESADAARVAALRLWQMVRTGDSDPLVDLVHRYTIESTAIAQDEEIGNMQ